MKKILALLALASVSMGSFAQDVVPEEKYSIATNSFGSNWFVQAGLDWNAWYSAEERGHDLSKSPFKKFRSNPGISLAFGKWFTPGIGLRTNNYTMNYSLGLHSAWKVAEKVQLFAEAGLNTFDHNIDNCAGSADQSWTRRCKNYYFELGVTYNLGSSRWRKAPDMDIVDTLHQSELAALEDANAETERLRGLLEKKQAGEKDSEHAIDEDPADSVDIPADSGDAPADSGDAPADSVEQ